MSAKTVLNFVQRIGRLYEQGADWSRIGQYARRWRGWATAAQLPTPGVDLFIEKVLQALSPGERTIKLAIPADAAYATRMTNQRNRLAATRSPPTTALE